MTISSSSSDLAEVFQAYRATHAEILNEHRERLDAEQREHDGYRVLIARRTARDDSETRRMEAELDSPLRLEKALDVLLTLVALLGLLHAIWRW